MQPFKINDEFTVIPGSNVVINEVKLEPRLMKLLCLLAEKKGNLVSREEIIEKIWNGYGGGDEGLTQAVSFLRKILNDTDKAIIETVPKGGYIFKGKIDLITSAATVTVTPETPPLKRTINFKTAAIIAGLLAIVILAGFYFYSSQRNIAPQASPAPQEKAPAETAPTP